MAPESSTLKKGSRVVVITDLPGVSAGTTGRVGRSIGVKAARYRVKFDNGVDVLSVAEGKLVSPAAWEFLKQSQTGDSSNVTQVTVSAAVPVGAAAVAAPAPEMAPPAQAPPKVAPPAPPVAKKPKPEASSDAGSASDDPRLAALTAKSREARKALGIDVDAEDSAAPEPQTDEESNTSEDEVADQDTADTTPAEVETELEPALPPMPDGYYPADNRIADLLASVRQS
jgi:hypothetical protein